MDGHEDLACAHLGCAAGVSGSRGVRPVVFVPDPAQPACRSFRLFTAGPALLRFVDGSNAFCSLWPDQLSDVQRDRVSAFFGDLQDWINTSGDRGSAQARRDISRAVNGHLQGLAGAGLAVGARERFLILTGGRDAQPLPWRVTDIKVQAVMPAQIAHPAITGGW